MRLLLLLPFIPYTLALEFPFKIPYFFNAKVRISEPSHRSTTPTTPKVAIIGAGAAGTSAAFWLSKAKERFGINVDIDIYEQSSYVGGRSTVVYPYSDTTLPPLELGASIFVKANRNLWRATDEFNLTRRDFRAEDDDNSEMGIWDGERILVTVSDGWFDMVKLFWRYGFSPKKMQSIVDKMIERILVLYGHKPPQWDTVSYLSEVLGWTSLTGNTTEKFLSSQGISDAFAQEIVEGSTRVNYGQNIDGIHALEGLCSMATGGATGVKGGNFKIFEEFVTRSGANLLLNTAVTSIVPKGGSTRQWTVQSSLGSTDYQAVILAAPFHSTGIAIPASLSSQIPEQPYVRLHVTLLTTTAPAPDPTYFALSPSSKVPRMVLTSYEGVRKGGKEPEFNSLSYHGHVRDGEWAVKIFSKEAISDEWLNKLFLGKVGWVYRKQWDAYPVLPPTTTFPPVKLDRGFFYVNAFEPFISTMETETVASRNVVDLFLNEEYQLTLCGARLPSTDDSATTEAGDDFVYGWDC
ncbi:hypothetical protein AMATHDRAFT_72501 [Amanita thiersii Skay4041]|uniref:Prenylcysteine lyase domain-containing protein n=1 Tax=Amanita thiersii Skay4041 TaxID=703135 RepID=A0A2A9NUT3_9AGAR|nr:hypothetical protein AMATHDRAFT_72501 [Amanita thiersii Skay4041]